MIKENLGQDFLASIVVFLVALPLCMGIAIASGVPPAMGLLSGIVGGLVVGFLAGSPLQVSGPAAGLAVIVLEAVQEFGLPTLGIMIFVAGILQMVAGFFKVGQLFRAVAPSVIYAMLAGIGILIFGSQFHVMVDDAPQGSGLTNLVTIPSAIIKGLTPSEDTPHHLAAIVGAITLAVLIGWNVIKDKLPSAVSKVPAPLLAVTVATVAAQVMGLPIAYVQLPSDLSALVTLPEMGAFADLAKPAVLGTAVAIAIVASAESLLCAAAVDRMHSGEPSDLDKELVAQGVGNTILGLLGGLPLTGVIVRSTANIEAGGQTRMSAIFHGGWLLIMITTLPWVLQMIPVSSLAAILVFIGYKLVNKDAIKELYGRGKGEIGVYLVTVACIVSINLLDGLLIGFILSIFHLAWKASQLEVAVEKGDNKIVDIRLKGAATFLVINKLTSMLDSVDQTSEIHVHLEHLAYIDHACFTALSEWGERCQAKGGTMVLEWDELTQKSQGLHIADRNAA